MLNLLGQALADAAIAQLWCPTVEDRGPAVRREKTVEEQSHLGAYQLEKSWRDKLGVRVLSPKSQLFEPEGKRVFALLADRGEAVGCQRLRLDFQKGTQRAKKLLPGDDAAFLPQT